MINSSYYIFRLQCNNKCYFAYYYYYYNMIVTRYMIHNEYYINYNLTIDVIILLLSILLIVTFTL